ncbi:Phosphatidylinositol N-acetylglucosaminyltransferase subunit Q [Liparis tanakae]|uniref:Phosphatidylinositol N-acetylglucosaminyltransferase subunit Q n=1 Tax=Liparis tanakae TaxID=230148 RepID=A0A4Z2HPF5_9TELE|nr:Phosphatidylinositol N-acetylglucosaminyltransferase subunit Q [Liparis tanakae]
MLTCRSLSCCSLTVAMVIKVFFPQCCNRADSGLLVGRWLPGQRSAVVLAVIHYPFIPGQVKQYVQQMEAQSGAELSVLGSWSLPRDDQEGIESFLRDLSTIFPQDRWLQVHRQLGKTGFTCQVLDPGKTCRPGPDGKVVQRETTTKKKKKKKVEPCAEEEEQQQQEEEEEEEEQEEEEQEEEVIFVHYEQEKVMFSQLHPVESPVPETDAAPPSELRRVRGLHLTLYNFI